MKHYIKRMIPLAFATLIIATSCSDTQTNTQEETEITSMDSTAKAVKDSTDRLEEQTKKVEASLEKLDSEFKTPK